jgi:hypothetical protein
VDIDIGLEGTCDLQRAFYLVQWNSITLLAKRYSGVCVLEDIGLVRYRKFERILGELCFPVCLVMFCHCPQFLVKINILLLVIHNTGSVIMNPIEEVPGVSSSQFKLICWSVSPVFL